MPGPSIPTLPAKIKDWASMLEFIRSKDGPEYLDHLTKLQKDLEKTAARVGKAKDIAQLHADAVAIEAAAKRKLTEAKNETLAMKAKLIGQIEVETEKLKDAIEKWDAGKRADQGKLRQREANATAAEEEIVKGTNVLSDRRAELDKREEAVVRLERDVNDKLAQIDQLVKAVG